MHNKPIFLDPNRPLQHELNKLNLHAFLRARISSIEHQLHYHPTGKDFSFHFGRVFELQQLLTLIRTSGLGGAA